MVLRRSARNLIGGFLVAGGERPPCRTPAVLSLPLRSSEGMIVTGVPVVGVPRALLYHKYSVLWSVFLDGIGCRQVVSPPTNRRIVERGTALAVDESCLSMKVFLGHVDAVAPHCDHVLVPRIESLVRGEKACVKFMGAPDIVRNTLPEVSVVCYDVDVAGGSGEREALTGLGASLCGDVRRARRAYRVARAAQDQHDAAKAVAHRAMLKDGAERPLVLVVGHSYNLADAMIGEPVIDCLRAEGATVLTSDDVDHRAARRRAGEISRSIKWTYNKEILGAIQAHRGEVDGIVFIVTFPCGPDSLMVELAQRRLPEVPIAILVVDELSGESGLRTRLESFIDILRLRTRS